MDEAESEWQWFRRSIRDSLLRPHRFALSLAGEPYGIAGVLVAILSGIALSLAVDLAVIGAKGVDPLDFVVRMIGDGALLGLRLAIFGSVVALAITFVPRVRRRAGVSLDQSFTAVAFSLAPLLVTPILALMLLVFPDAVAIVGVMAVALGLRLLYGLFENLRHLMPVPAAIIAVLITVAGVPLVLADQVSRIEFTALGYAPELAPPIEAGAPSGTPFPGDGYSLTLPGRWRSETLALPNEAGRFVTETDVLVVMRISGSALLTLEGYAETVGVPWRRGLDQTSSSRTIERVGHLVVVDDVYRGSVDGRPELLRQVTTVVGTRGLALQFRYIDPDAPRALAESAAIAASWRVGGP